MRAIDIIIKKRSKFELTKREISFMVQNYVNNIITDYQMSSFLMACFLNGLNNVETSYLTKEMIMSGDRYDLSKLEKYCLIDKHSTGGVGDKTSLILAPIASYFNLKVPMMSGRGLGHTGGTLDKLESIKGYKVLFNQEKFINIISECGYVMVGQTDDIVPADKKIYALRDASGTVESIPLLTSSILSKKVAEGAKNLVMDVKMGSGAFMKEHKDAFKLAESIIKTSKELGLNTRALITDMSNPLGRNVGNFLEVKECIEIIDPNIFKEFWTYQKKNLTYTYKGLSSDLMIISIELASHMLMMCNKARDKIEAQDMIIKAIENGNVLDIFYKNVELQGGDLSRLKRDLQERSSPYKYQLLAEKDGYIKDIDAYKIGAAAVLLKAGRDKKNDIIDYDSGIVFFKKKEDFVKKGETILEIHAKKEKHIENSLPLIKVAITITDNNKDISPFLGVIEELINF